MKDVMGREMSVQSVTAEGLGSRGGFQPKAVRFVPKKCPR